MVRNTTTIASILTFALLIFGAQPRAVAQSETTKISRPAPFLVKEYNGQDWLLPDGIAIGGSLQKLAISKVAGNTQPRPIETGIFRLAWSAAAPPSTAEISMTGALDLFAPEAGERRKLWEAFEAFQTALDHLEKDKSLIPGGARLVASRLAEQLPLPISETLLYSFGLVSNVPFLEAKQTYVDLKPGLRLKVISGGFYNEDDSGHGLGSFGGTGVDYITLASVPGSNKVAYNGFPDLSKDRRLEDLLKAANQKAYQRLYYASASNGGAAAAILRADFYKNLSVEVPKSSKSAFFFPGRIIVIPEFEVNINGTGVYVPVGTTLRHIVEQEMNTLVRPPRLKLKRKNSGYTVHISFADPRVGFDLPLLPGDRVIW